MRRRPRAPRLVATVAAFALMLLAPAVAGAADSVYWANAEAGTIRVAGLDGSGSATTLYSGEDYPQGVALDLAAGKIYWADTEAGTIRVGNLDGSGTATTLFSGERLARGVAIDPAAGKIYWAADGLAAIRVGNLDGSGVATSLYEGEGGPWGLAIDPGAGKLYWADTGIGTIRAGNLDGSGAATSLYSGETTPIGATIEPTSGEILWSSGGSIRKGNVDGSATTPAATLFGGEAVPEGVAIDPAAQTIYWANAASSGAIRRGNLGGGAASTVVGGSQQSPSLPALMLAPEPTAAPRISGGEVVGEELSCDEGSWGEDVPGAFLFRRPTTFAYQWLRDGSAIPGSTTATFTPSEAGSYSCRVVASNQAGGATQTSLTDEVRSAPPGCSDDCGPSTLLPPRPTCKPLKLKLQTGGSRPVALSCEGSVARYSIVVAPRQGRITAFNSASGTLVYTPNRGFVGGDTFSYVASNSSGESTPATVNVAVTAAPSARPGKSAHPNQPGSPSNEFSIARLKRDAKRGTARLLVRLPGAGTVKLLGPAGLNKVQRRVGAAAGVSLPVRVHGQALRRLRQSGRSLLSLRLVYIPDGGAPRTRRTKIFLLLRRQ